MFHLTWISLYTIYSEKQKSCKVRAICIYIPKILNCTVKLVLIWNSAVWKTGKIFGTNFHTIRGVGPAVVSLYITAPCLLEF